MKPLFLVLALATLGGCVKTVTVGVKEHPYTEDLTVCLFCLTTPMGMPGFFADCAEETTYGVGWSQNTRLGFIFRREDGDCQGEVDSSNIFGRIRK